jgi:predicted permease
MNLLSWLQQKWAEMQSWTRATTNRGKLELEMEAEFEHHLGARTTDLIRSGKSPAEAARLARIELGPALMHKEGMRDSLGLRWVDELGSDLKYAMRMLWKSPGFTAIAAVSLGLAIGANTAIFSIARQLLYQRLNVPHAGDLRLLRWNGDQKSVVHGMWGDFDASPESGVASSIFSYPVYQQLREHNQVLEDLFAYKEDSMNATIHGDAQNATVVMVSGSYFSSTGIQPQLGRVIQSSDDSSTAPNVALIGDGVWQRDFGRSPSAIGETITVNQTPFTVIGIVPRDFTGVKGVMEKPDVFVPLRLQPIVDPKGKSSLLSDQNTWWVNVMARTKPGMDDRTAQAALQVQFEAAVRATMTVTANDTIPRLAIVDGSRGLHFADQRFKKPIYILLGLTGFVILLACANIANLLLARGAQRQREMSVRMALGAGRIRILRQLLTESVLLAVIGGVLGVGLGYFGRDILPNLLTNAWENQDINTPFDWTLFALTAGVTLATGILFGLAPALVASRAQLSSSLKDTAQQATRQRKGVTGRSIVAFQIALSTLLVIGAGLFMRTLLQLNSVDVGFNANNLLLFEVSPPNARYGPEKDVKLHEELERRFAASPGVESVSPAEQTLISGGGSNADFIPEGSVDPSHERSEDVDVVGSTYFSTMQIPIVAGRSFNSQDTSSSPKAIIINEKLAQTRFPNENPVGKRVRADGGSGLEWFQIVGICRGARYMNIRDDSPPMFYMLYTQQHQAGVMTYQVRTHVAAATLVPELRRIVQQADRDLPMINVRTQREQINSNMQIERAFAALTAGFGVLALALACVGIYGIMAYSVAQRRNEIGIRLALGAQPGQVRGMILRESTWLTLAGIAVGVGGALVCTRLVRSMLYGVTPNDPATIMMGIAVLIAVALLSTWIPARRAAAVQPMEALRHE